MSVFTRSVAVGQVVSGGDPVGAAAFARTARDPRENQAARRSFVTTTLLKYRGDRSLIPAMPSLKAVALAWLGGVIAIAVVSKLGMFLSVPLMLGSFGASCVLVFGFPDVPFSQPRNVIAGHVLSSAIGLAFLAAFGPQWWAMGLATGTAIAVMMLTRTVHPPAGSNPVIVFLSQPAWGFLLHPTLIGAVLIVVISLIYNNAVRGGTKYPRYW